MKELTKGIIIVSICLIIIIGFIFYAKAILGDTNNCQDGNQKGRLTQGDITYLECGTYGEYEWTDYIKDNKIVREKIYSVNESSHIEEFKTNWTDNQTYQTILIFWSLFCMFALIGLFYWIKELIAIGG